MTMKQPCHPGAIIKYDIVDALGLSVTAAAAALGVSRKTLSELVNERAGVSADMAVRLTKAFGGSARLWLDMQTAHDLSKIKQSTIKVKRFKGAVIPEEDRPSARRAAKAASAQVARP